MKRKLRISSVLLVLVLFCSAFMFISCGNATDKAEVTFLAGSVGDKIVQNMPAQQKVTIGQKSTKPLSEPTFEDGVFKAWADLATGLPFDFNTVIEKDVTLYAQWSEARIITFNKGFVGEDEVLNLPEKQFVEPNKTPEYPDEALFRKGYTFTGWYTQESDGERFNFKSAVNKHTQLYAQWKQGKEKLKIACVGDSITEGVGGGGQTYPNYLSQELGAGNTIGNFGVSNATVTADGGGTGNNRLPYIEQGAYRNSLNYNADIVIIMLGTNDSKVWDVAKLTYEKDLKAIVKAYQDKTPGVSVMLMTSPPGDKSAWKISAENITNYIYPIQLSIAKELGLGVIELHKELVENNLVQQLITDDNVHFSAAGYQYFAKFIAQEVRHYMGIAGANQYNITFNKGLVGSDEVLNLPEIQLVRDNNNARYPLKALFRKGYTFAGWYTQEVGGELFNFKRGVKADVELFAQWKKGKDVIKVSCVGDSITEGNEARGRYPEDMQEILFNEKLTPVGGVKNFGVGGATLTICGTTGTDGTRKPYREEAKYTESKAYKSDVMVIMLGTNDAKTDAATGWEAMAKLQFEQDLKDLVKAYQTANPGVEIMLMTSPQIVSNRDYGVNSDIIDREICPIQRSVAHELGLGLIDLHDIIVGDLLTKYWHTDKVHYTGEGYQYIAEVVASAVKNYMGIEAAN